MSLIDSAERNPIQSITVSDNGIGFDVNNFKSFLESDSTYKAAIGGKGVGRFSWLVAFEKATIDSIFTDEDGNRVKRSFDFTQNSEGIDDTLVDCNEENNITRVKLINFKTNYQKKCAQTTCYYCYKDSSSLPDLLHERKLSKCYLER